MKSTCQSPLWRPPKYVALQIRKLQDALLQFDLGRDLVRCQIVNQYASGGEFADCVQRGQIGSGLRR